MIIDTLSLEEQYMKNALWCVKSLRSRGVGAFVSLTIVDGTDLGISERSQSGYCVEIVDETGAVYHVCIEGPCTAYTLIYPDGSTETAVLAQPVF